MKRTTVLIPLLPGLLLGLLAGCGDPLAPPWLIDKPRVIGARVETANDPTRPWPRPGEQATVTWMVAAPAGTAPMRWALAACVPDVAGSCGQPIAVASGDASPMLPFQVPPAEQLGATTKLMVAGVFCAGGQPALVMGEPTCQGEGAVATVVSLAVPLERTPETNRSPSLASATFTLAGAPWPTGDDCAALPRVAADGVERPITFTLAGQREIYESRANADGVPTPTREALQLSHFATAGKLPRQLSFIESGDDRDPAALTVAWTPPPAAEVPAAGLPVRFYFVARDLRGGIDWQSRALCVTATQP